MRLNLINRFNLFFFVFLFLVIIGFSKAESNQVDNLKAEVSRNPKNYQAHFRLAGELLNAKDYHGAAKEYQFIIDENEKKRISIILPFANLSQSLGRVHMGLGFSLDFLNEDERAIKELNRAIEIDPQLEQHLMLQITLGAIYGDLGLKEKELSKYQKVIEIDPQYYPAYLNLAIALGEIERVSDAITVLKRVILIKPDYAKAYNQLGIAYEIMRNYRQSIEHYLIAQKLYSKKNDLDSEKEVNQHLKHLYKMLGTPHA